MSGVLQWMAISSSERIGKERSVGRALYVREHFDVIELVAKDDKVESLWVKIRRRANKANIQVRESVIVCSTRMKRQIKCSMRS